VTPRINQVDCANGRPERGCATLMGQKSFLDRVMAILKERGAFSRAGEGSGTARTLCPGVGLRLPRPWRGAGGARLNGVSPAIRWKAPRQMIMHSHYSPARQSFVTTGRCVLFCGGLCARLAQVASKRQNNAGIAKPRASACLARLRTREPVARVSVKGGPPKRNASLACDPV
jgi:hypothetical protein